MKYYYTITPKNPNNPYETVCFLANTFSHYSIILESKFAYYQNIHACLFSVDADNQYDFEKTLYNHGYDFKKYDLYNEYLIWKEKTKKEPIKTKLDDSFLDNSTIIEVVNEVVPAIEYGENGRQILDEETICKKENIKLYTHSNEMCGHHIPHIHVEYGGDKNYCVISILDKRVLEPKNFNNKIVKKAIDLLNQNYKQAVIAWNKTSGCVKMLE